MFDVQHWPFEESGCFVLSVGPRGVRMPDVRPGPLEGSECLILVPGPSRGQNV